MDADICRAALVALAMGLSAGCSGVKTYPNTLDKNLQIRSETVTGSPLFRVRTALSVYRVDERCELAFEGVVNIDHCSPLVARHSTLVSRHFPGASFSV